MISQFFEVQIKEGKVDRYLDLAASLRPSLDAMGGCLSIDRFRSLSRKNLLLSYQIWQDEGSMTAWRVNAKHHSVQETGREIVFADYRIRIAHVVHEQRANGSAWQPERLSGYNDPARRLPTFVVAWESSSPESLAHITWTREVFESVYRPGIFVHLMDVPSFDSGLEFAERLFESSPTEHIRVSEVMRDYGMFDRREAPQYYPPIPVPLKSHG